MLGAAEARPTLARRLQASRLERRIAAMPEYPIYREPGGRYSLYTAGERREFASRPEAELGQLQARASWLRAGDERHT